MTDIPVENLDVKINPSDTPDVMHDALRDALKAAYEQGYTDGYQSAFEGRVMDLRLESIRLAAQIKSGSANGDTRAVIRSAHGIYDFIKTGNRHVKEETDN